MVRPLTLSEPNSDNVGGEMLDMCLTRLNKGARIARELPSVLDLIL
jgi:hypothetical protein